MLGPEAGLECNLCWEVVCGAFLLTKCNHALCTKHESDPRIQSSTCPCCGTHLPLPADIQVVRMAVEPEVERALCGLHPRVATRLIQNALEFWHYQDCLRAERRAQELTEERQRVHQAALRVAQLEFEAQVLQERVHELQKRKAGESPLREVRAGQCNRGAGSV
jgi:hypothetical protein